LLKAAPSWWSLSAVAGGGGLEFGVGCLEFGYVYKYFIESPSTRS